MPKRKSGTSVENIEYHRRKIKKLEEKQRQNRRRILIESSSDSDESSTSSAPVRNSDSDAANFDADEDAIGGAAEVAGLVPTVDMVTPCEETEASPDLDPELLGALGEETGNDPKFGEKIHQSLAQRWEPLLKKGLLKEAKDKLLKDYLVPENCTLLQAPKLNMEVAAAISEASRQRDKRKETEQQQLGVGISAINKALTSMLTSDNKIEAIRLISDGCRILTDLHYRKTEARISLINYSLAKPFLNVVQDSERDDTLYGTKLAGKIKASKTIEKQGFSIKKFTKTQKTSASEQTPSSARTQYQYKSTAAYQGNWSGPSRFQQNRGGRRGSGRTYNPVVGRRPPLQQQSASTAGPSKQRQPAARH